MAIDCPGHNTVYTNPVVDFERALRDGDYKQCKKILAASDELTLPSYRAMSMLDKEIARQAAARVGVPADFDEMKAAQQCHAALMTVFTRIATRQIDTVLLDAKQALAPIPRRAAARYDIALRALQHRWAREDRERARAPR